MPDDLPSDVINDVFPDAVPLCVSFSEQKFVGQLCAQSGVCSYEATQRWFRGNQMIEDSMVFRVVSNFFSEASLWAHTNWYQSGGGNNEVSEKH